MKTIKNIKNKFGFANGDFNVDLSKNSIRIYGTYTNNKKNPQTFDKTFKIGDLAQYDSYNLIYCGKIRSIGNKTVTIADGDEVKRLNFWSFINKNWNYDLHKIQQKNLEMSNQI